MTKDELLSNIDNAITTKTEINSITPLIHGEILKAVVEWLYNQIVLGNTDIFDIANIFQKAPENNILPALTSGECRIYFAAKSGTYYTENREQRIIVNAGEKAIIKYNGEQWEKISIDTLAQDIAGQSTDIALSQAAVKQIVDNIEQQINNIGTGTSSGLQQEQSDWTEENNSNVSFIKNKPTKLSDFENDLNDVYLQKSSEQDTAIDQIDKNYNNKKIYFRLFDENNQTVQKISYEVLAAVLLEKYTELKLFKEKTFKKLKVTHPGNLGYVADGSVFEFSTSSIYWNGVRLFPDISYTLTQDKMIEFNVTDDNGNNIYPVTNDILMIEAYFE